MSGGLVSLPSDQPSGWPDYAQYRSSAPAAGRIIYGGSDADDAVPTGTSRPGTVSVRQASLTSLITAPTRLYKIFLRRLPSSPTARNPKV